MSNTREHEYDIEVPGIPAELRSLAEENIRMLIICVATVAEKLNIPFMLKRVRVTNHFEDDVNQLLKESSGLTGYSAVRDNVLAFGKTIWTRSQQGDIGSSVVIDANVIGTWSLNNSMCLTTILHELAHVLYKVRHIRRLGDEEFTADSDTRERWLDGWASSLLDEFDVDRLVDSIVHKLATKDDGQPWSLRELDEAQGVEWVDSLLDALNRMPKVIDEKVCQFRTKQMCIDDLYTEVIPHVKDLLILLSHTAARYLGTEHWSEIVGCIKSTEASQRFFKENLDTIIGQFDDPQQPFDASVQTVAQAVEGIFRYCGLSFRTEPQGVYISVDAPSR